MFSVKPIRPGQHPGQSVPGSQPVGIRGGGSGTVVNGPMTKIEFKA